MNRRETSREDDLRELRSNAPYCCVLSDERIVMIIGSCRLVAVQ